MKIALVQEMDMPCHSLAKALAESSPEDFAAFWLAFYTHCEKHKPDLSALAKAMAPMHGAGRKSIFRELERLISYHEERMRREGVDY